MKIEAEIIEDLSSKLTSVFHELVQAMPYDKTDESGKTEIDLLEVKMKCAALYALLGEITAL